MSARSLSHRLRRSATHETSAARFTPSALASLVDIGAALKRPRGRTTHPEHARVDLAAIYNDLRSRPGPSLVDIPF